MKLKKLFLIMLIFHATNVFGKVDEKPKGYVPDETTAVKIAEAVLVPIYGTEQIEKERPLKAHIEGGVWTVEGTLPPNMLGGVAIVKIKKSTGEILKVTHGK